MFVLSNNKNYSKTYLKPNSKAMTILFKPQVYMIFNSSNLNGFEYIT